MTKINTIILPAGDGKLINLMGDYLLGTVQTEKEYDCELFLIEEFAVPVIDEESERDVEILGHTISISDDEFRILCYDDDVCIDNRVKDICRTETVECSDIIMVYELPPSEYLYILAELELRIEFESAIENDT